MQLGRRKKYGSGNPNRVSKSSLTASGERVTRRGADSMRRLQQPWQARSFAYYDMLGEIKYAAQFYARMLAPLRLYAAEINEDGELKPTTNEAAIEALDRIRDPGMGGRSGLLSQYGRLMFLTGEGYLFVSKDPETDEEQWEMLSTDELRIDSGTMQRIKAPALQAETYREPTDEDWEPIDDDSAIAYRLWKRHPRYSALADATMQGVLDECEELVLLTQAVRSRARSRLAGSGILFVDEAISQKPLEAVPDEDIEADPFLRDLIEAMTAPMADEGAASAVVPLVVRVKGTDERPVRDMVHHLQLIDPMQLYPETGLRYELIKRIAIGLDMPPEILLGLMDANHWTGWMIDEQTWKGHGQPIAQQFCDDLTSSYFRPTLKEAAVPDWQRYAIAYDEAAIVTHPDRSRDAKDLYDKRAIGKASLREASGFTDDDAPTEEERAEMVGIAVRDGSLAWYGMPSPRSGGVETAPGVIEDGTDPATADGGAPDVTPAPPVAPSETASHNGNGHATDASVARILGAVDLALLRAREAAGNRLKSLAKRGDEDTRNAIEGVRAGDIASVLGRVKVRELKAPPDTDLIAGARELIADAFRVWDVTDPDILEVVTSTVEQHAARTLYDTRPAALPQSFTEYLNRLVTGVKA